MISDRRRFARLSAALAPLFSAALAGRLRPRLVAAVASTCLLSACASEVPRFPLRFPLLIDTDMRVYQANCQRDQGESGEKSSCAPVPYVSPLAWDAVDNSIFLPFTRFWKVDPPGAAVNVNALDEVPDSAWFTNRPSKEGPERAAALALGACEPEDMLDPEHAETDSWLVDKGKSDGSTPGFRVRIGGKKYMLKSDKSPKSSAAAVIGAAIYHAVGFNTSCEQVVYFDPKVLKLKPGLTTTDNSGVTKPLDEKTLQKIVDNGLRKGKLVRMQASAWLEGHLLGPFSYQDTRADDPNDVIPHQDRRELRGARVLAAWVDHFDAREQNSMDSWISANPDDEDSSPGFVRHYYLDFSDTLGSEWVWDDISRRLGHSYLLDWGDIAQDLVTLGIPRRRWDVVERTPGEEMFGYFHAYDFEPDGWKNEYPNPAFSRATEHDNAWMARILARFERADIDTFVELGKFEEPHKSYLTRVLEGRLQRILERYLLVLSPLAQLEVRGGNSLCATDWARRRELRPAASFRYAATLENAGQSRPLSVKAAPRGALCLSLPHVAPEGAVRADDPARYVVVTIANGASAHPLRAHLYDLGPKAGYRLVGLERPGED